MVQFIVTITVTAEDATTNVKVSGRNDKVMAVPITKPAQVPLDKIMHRNVQHLEACDDGESFLCHLKAFTNQFAFHIKHGKRIPKRDHLFSLAEFAVAPEICEKLTFTLKHVSDVHFVTGTHY